VTRTGSQLRILTGQLGVLLAQFAFDFPVCRQPIEQAFFTPYPGEHQTGPEKGSEQNILDQKILPLCELFRLCGKYLCRRLPLGNAFAQDLIEQGFVDELSGVDRLIDFLRGAGEIDQELKTVDAIFPVRAE
jgi:hypothetical protein